MDLVRYGMMYEEKSRVGVYILYYNMDKVGKSWNDGKRGRLGGVFILYYDMDKIGREIEWWRRVRLGVGGGCIFFIMMWKKLEKDRIMEKGWVWKGYNGMYIYLLWYG